MRCFACDRPVDPRKSVDGETGRFYCEACFEETNKVKLKYLLDDMILDGECENVLDPLIDNSVEEDIFEYQQVSDHYEEPFDSEDD